MADEGSWKKKAVAWFNLVSGLLIVKHLKFMIDYILLRSLYILRPSVAPRSPQLPLLTSFTGTGWSNLLSELLGSISNRLEFIDYISFRGVCKSWRSVAQKRPQLPLLVSFTVGANSLSSTLNFFKFSGAEVVPFELNVAPDKFCCGSSHGWLALIDSTPRLTLFNPLTNSQIDPPPYSPFLPQKQPVTNLKPLRKFYSRTKIVLSADPSVDPGFMVIQMGGALGTTMVFWRNGDACWRKVDHPGSRFDGGEGDVLFYKGDIVFTLEPPNSRYYDVFAYNIEQNRLFRRIPATGIVAKRCFLVDSDGDLLFVALSCMLGEELDLLYRFEVYKVVLDEHKLVKVEILGDRALLLGHNLGISVHASEYPGCRANCIYLTEYNQKPPAMVRVCLKDGSNEFIKGPLSQFLPNRALISCLWLKPSLLQGPRPLT